MIEFKSITITRAVVAILFSFTLVATVTTEAATQNGTASQSEEGWSAIELFVPLVGAAIAVVAAITGVVTYSYNKKKDRLTQITMPLLKEYNELDESEIAVMILNDYPHTFKQEDDPQAYRLYNGEISKTGLPLVLRDHRWVDTSPVEEKVVESFDALLYFLAEVELVVQGGIAKSEDLSPFLYEIEKIAQEPAILNFVNVYRLTYFKGRLDPRLKMDEKSKGANIVGTEEEVEQYFKRLKNAGYVPANS